MRLTGLGVSVELTVCTKVDVEYRAQVHGELEGVAGVNATPEELEGCGKVGTEDEDVGVDTIVLVSNATVELVSELEMRGNAGRDEDEGVDVGDGVRVKMLVISVLISVLVSALTDEVCSEEVEVRGKAGGDENEGVVGVETVLVWVVIDDEPSVVLGSLGKAGRLEDDGVGVGVAKILVLSSLLVSPTSDEELSKTLEDIGKAGKDEDEGVKKIVGAIFVVELTAEFEEELESRGKGSWDDVNDGEDVTTVDEEVLREIPESEEEEACL
ncbi:MAG: hypothetical protein Q9162_004240 [Coniocarpon cinnabarinum]